MNEFKVFITSPPDREKLVAEIWYNEILVAEINQESENLEIEFYQFGKVTFILGEFLEILNHAKTKLTEQ